jgi:hypothetical protein
MMPVKLAAMAAAGGFNTSRAISFKLDPTVRATATGAVADAVSGASSPHLSYPLLQLRWLRVV